MLKKYTVFNDATEEKKRIDKKGQLNPNDNTLHVNAVCIFNIPNVNMRTMTQACILLLLLLLYVVYLYHNFYIYCCNTGRIYFKQIVHRRP